MHETALMNSAVQEFDLPNDISLPNLIKYLYRSVISANRYKKIIIYKCLQDLILMLHMF